MLDKAQERAFGENSPAPETGSSGFQEPGLVSAAAVPFPLSHAASGNSPTRFAAVLY